MIIWTFPIPAHGGDDPGASGNGIIEKDKTLQISNYMYDKLRNLDFDVAITRTTDETINPNERVERILAPYGNGSDVIVISNHINAGGSLRCYYKGLNLKKLFLFYIVIY